MFILQLAVYMHVPRCSVDVVRPRHHPNSPQDSLLAASVQAHRRHSLLSVPHLHRTGVFVGGDALYCCLEHPDSGLRSNLTLSCPLNRGRVRPRDGGVSSDDVERLLGHGFGLVKREPTRTPTLVTYKSTSTPDEVRDLAAILLESFEVCGV